MAVTRVLIHAGFHKTGTSSVQAALSAGRSGWETQLRIALRDDLGALPSAARKWSRTPSEQGLKAVREAAEATMETFAPDDPRPLVISSEDLAGTLPGRGLVRDYSALPVLAKSLCDAVQARFPADVTFLFTTRAADPWLRSLWWQHIRVLRYQTSRDDFCRDYAGAADFERILDATRQSVPHATIQSIALEDAAGMQAGPVTPLLDWAGLPPEDWGPAPPRSNARPELGLEEVFLALNKSGLSDAYIKALKQKLLRKAKRIQL